MIHFILMVNKQGQTRLATYFKFLTVEQRTVRILLSLLFSFFLCGSPLHCTWYAVPYLSDPCLALLCSPSGNGVGDHPQVPEPIEHAVLDYDCPWLQGPTNRRCIWLWAPFVSCSVRQCDRFHAWSNFMVLSQVVYRRYASLYFIVGVGIDDDENELALLEAIHCLVETLDRYYESVVRGWLALPSSGLDE